MNLRILVILLLICICSVLMNTVKKDNVPLCMNADESAFGYNAYSILKTGKDEYGTSLPLRLKSFGDYKMPLYSYLSAPFIGTIGLNETGARALNTVLAFLFPIAVFALSKEFFKNDTTALIASFLTAISLGLAIVGRQAHEAYLAALLTTASCAFFIRWMKTQSKTSAGLFLLSLFFLLFSYQTARIFAVFFLLYAFVRALQKKLPFKYFVLLFCILIIFAVPDVIYKPARVSNLLFYKNPGLGMKADEYRNEGGSKILYNKVTIGLKDFAGQHLLYYSPQFLTVRGDDNFRFGFSDMPPITYVEYIFFFAGLYFLIRKKERFRYFLLGLLLVTPLAGSLSWAGHSLTRVLFLIPLIAIISSHGFVEYLKTVVKKRRKYATGIAAITFFVFLFYSWNFYLNHYTKRSAVITAEQCGYRELSSIVKETYPKVDHIYISRAHGDPYIFMLFYLHYDPAKYQKQASLSPPDVYGFGQVEAFDKFKFTLPDQLPSNSLIIGSPEDFTGRGNYKIRKEKVRIIKFGKNEMFWIYRT